MNDDTLKLLDRAAECLQETETLLENGHYLGAVNRAYYAIFDCARALLAAEGIWTKTHQGVHSQFNEFFVHPGKFDACHNGMLTKVFALRQLADYDLDADLTHANAEFALQSAREFYDATRRYFKL